MNFAQYIRQVPDFPKPGVLFWDFAPLLASPKALKQAIYQIKDYYQGQNLTHIAAIEAKGFTLGAALAYEMALPLILIRKPNLIPGEVNKATFIKEYGEGEYQINAQSVTSDHSVLLVYDILAAPGASCAAINLIEAQGAKVVGCAYAIELLYLEGRQSLKKYQIYSLVQIADKTIIESAL
jgi:adenine phosphoribosyltransferase